ncbi:hypothetical protein [Rhizobium lentis]|nr:hypothetical protein [Rhizobium lentis]MBX5014751.1 hypothetical protein [Rhizobium lentis]
MTKPPRKSLKPLLSDIDAPLPAAGRAGGEITPSPIFRSIRLDAVSDD